MEAEEFLRMILTERICGIVQEKYKRDNEQKKSYQQAMDEWEQTLKKQGTDIKQAFDQYFSIKEAWESDEQEALYLAGFTDAIRLLKRIRLI